MSNKGNAYAVASAIYAGRKFQDEAALAEALYTAVDGLGFGTDERKADLYAQLADNLTPNTGFEDAVRIVEAAMNSTDKVVGRG